MRLPLLAALLCAAVGCATHSQKEDLYWKGFDDGFRVAYKNFSALPNQSAMENAE